MGPSGRCTSGFHRTSPWWPSSVAVTSSRRGHRRRAADRTGTLTRTAIGGCVDEDPEEATDAVERGAREIRARVKREVAARMRSDQAGLFSYDGPDGHRQRLLGTRLDVWQVVETVRQNDGSAEAAAAYLEVPVERIRGAIAYHAEHRAEIDGWIAEADDRAHDEGIIGWLEGTL